jgi:hypothetical protein
MLDQGLASRSLIPMPCVGHCAGCHCFVSDLVCVRFPAPPSSQRQNGNPCRSSFGLQVCAPLNSVFGSLAVPLYVLQIGPILPEPARFPFPKDEDLSQRVAQVCSVVLWADLLRAGTLT